MTKKYTIGWDIGGAHLKAALVDANGVAHQVVQTPCQLWKGLQTLSLAMQSTLKSMNQECQQSAITMTGELVDLFPNRQQGVIEIAKLVQSQLNHQPLYYAGNVGFVGYDKINDHLSDIASMNWHASAQYVSKNLKDGVLVDIGSTTTDIVPFSNGLLFNQGLTDAERLSCDELIYTGILRTPLMALGPKIQHINKQYFLAAEYFATTADVYRLLGQLAENIDVIETADSQGKSIIETARRLARMIGYDVEDAQIDDWVNLAQSFKASQLTIIKTAVLRHLQGNKKVIVGAGVGAFLVEELAKEMNCPYQDVKSMIQAVDKHTLIMAENCFPAYAVANLMNQDGLS